MSTDKKSAGEKAAKSLDFEKLNENESGQLTGGFSDATDDPDDGDAGFPEINISKCHCTTAPATPATTA
jgi:hypothetical protein